MAINFNLKWILSVGVIVGLIWIAQQTDAKKLKLSAETLESYGSDVENICDFYVSPIGDDNEEGSELQYPLKTIVCATDPNCNNGLEPSSTICVHESTIEVENTIRIKASFQITLLALGKGVTLDAFGQTQILNSGRTPIKMTGFTFTGGMGNSGAAAYGEARMEFIGCNFYDNEASADAAAVMVSREGHFEDCTFSDNRAKWGGAVRVSDIGAASFERCWFTNNQASSKGGALITQIESANKQFVKLKDTTFCLNSAPTGKHIFNFRDQGHQCKNCSFNTKDCCSGNGRVATSDDEGDNDQNNLPEVADPSAKDSEVLQVQYCSCDEGWEGKYCETNSSSIDGPKSEL